MKSSALRRFAIEWLWLLAFGVVPIILVFFAKGAGHLSGDLGDFVAFAPYPIAMGIRLTVWAIKTARKKEST